MTWQFNEYGSQLRLLVDQKPNSSFCAVVQLKDSKLSVSNLKRGDLWETSEILYEQQVADNISVYSGMCLEPCMVNGEALLFYIDEAGQVYQMSLNEEFKRTDDDEKEQFLSITSPSLHTIVTDFPLFSRAHRDGKFIELRHMMKGEDQKVLL